MHGHVLLHRFCFRGGRQTYSNILTSNERNQNVEEEMPISSPIFIVPIREGTRLLLCNLIKIRALAGVHQSFYVNQNEMDCCVFSN